MEQLAAKTEAYLALYEPETDGAQIKATAFQGDGCSALIVSSHLHESEILRPLGFQFGCVWMDVRYQDGDAWDLSLMKGADFRLNHCVNPWAHERKVEYNQEFIDFRINGVCESWPQQGDKLRPYLLLWRVPVVKALRTRFVARKGKANEADRCNYGDADQIHDFLRCFGIDSHSPKLVIGRGAAAKAAKRPRR